jgi:two-component system OmpR family sensor kinase
MRVASLPIEVRGAFAYAVQVGASLAPQRAFLHTVRLFIGAVGLAVVAVVLLVGAGLTRSALRPVDALIGAARRIGGGPLTARLPEPGTDDEIGRLAATLNEMLGRLARAVETERRFTTDAAHELRSPLSRLRAELEITLRRPRDAADYERVLRSGLEEVERLGRLTEALLTLARLDAGEGKDARAVTAVNAVIDATLEQRAGIADRRGVRLVRTLGDDVTVGVAPSFLALVAGNLVDNALKFSPAGGTVTVTTARRDGEVVLTVADAGPGIAADEVSRVFDRFYRGRTAGSPDMEGVGLGLAIVRSVVEAHGGRVAVESREGHGATFTVRLPVAA